MVSQKYFQEGPCILLTCLSFCKHFLLNYIHSTCNYILPFSLLTFTRINGEGPGILGVFTYLTSGFTYLFSVTTPNTQTTDSIHQLCVPMSCVPSRKATVTQHLLPSSLPWQVTSNSSTQGTEGKGQNCLLKTLI